MKGQNEELLKMTLAAAVPLWVREFRKTPWPELRAIAERSADVVASKGDVLQFGGGKKGEAAEAFNALARGIAILSFAPGGVKFAGMHFDNQHTDADAIVRVPTGEPTFGAQEDEAIAAGKLVVGVGPKREERARKRTAFRKATAVVKAAIDNLDPTDDEL